MTLLAYIFLITSIVFAGFVSKEAIDLLLEKTNAKKIKKFEHKSYKSFNKEMFLSSNYFVKQTVWTSQALFYFADYFIESSIDNEELLNPKQYKHLERKPVPQANVFQRKTPHTKIRGCHV